MKKLLPLFLISGTAMAIPLMELDLSVGVMQQKPSGYLQYRGDKLDVKNTLGLGDETKPFARLKFEHPVPLIPNLYGRYIPTEFTGNKTITSSIRYGDTVFTGNIKTTVKLDKYDLGVYYNVPFVGLATAGLLDPELGINFRYIDFEGKITGISGSQSVTRSKSASLVVPMLYAGLAVNLPIKVSLVGEARAIGYKGNVYYDWNGEIRLKPVGIPLIGHFYLGAGYREEKLKLDDISDIYSDIKVKGLYGVVGVNF